MTRQKYFISGFTLVEVLIVLSILGILLSLIISTFSSVGGDEALDTTTISVMSVLNEAKSMSVSSKDASNYGVRVFSDKLVTFKNSYGTDNKEVLISNLVRISTSTGIGSDIVFNNVSGKTSASGSIMIADSDDSSKINTIRVYSTGVIERE